MRTRIPLLMALLTFLSLPVVPHSGGTNADGCHTNRRTGDYHCHTPKSPPPGAETYCHVINGERRCGYSRSTCYDLVSNYGGYCRPE
jgi:hypothetical protein